MLASQQVTTLLARLRDAYDVVVIDSAPVLPVSDTLELLPHMDCVVMCLRVSKTPRDHARAAKTVIAELTSAPLALVLTGVKARNGLDPYAAYAYSGEFSSADRRWFRARARAGASSS
jgi:Mrp family chromosome partitioning ATPase